MSTEEHKVVSSIDSGRPWTSVWNSVWLRAWGLVLVGYCLISWFGNLSHRAGAILNDAAWTFSAALAAWSSYRASRSLTGADRRAWLCFACACLAWSVGQLIWDYFELVRGIEVLF